MGKGVYCLSKPEWPEGRARLAKPEKFGFER